MDVQHYRHPIFFYTASIGITWGTGVLVFHRSGWSTEAGNWIGLLAPLAMALIFIIPNTSLRKDVAGRALNILKVNPTYLSMAFLLMPFSLLTAQVISLFFGCSTDQFQFRDDLANTSGILSVGALCILIPVIQELAWHSYGTDCLRNRFSILNTSLLFTLLWTMWSLPLLSFVRGYDYHLVAEAGVLYTIHFYISPFPFFLLMNWLYYQTDRNIGITILFHLSARYFNELYATTPISRVIQTGLLMLFSIYLIQNNKQTFIKH